MQEKESIMVVRCELKIPSLEITNRHHSASLVMPNSYPRDRIFNPHLTTIKILILWHGSTKHIRIPHEQIQSYRVCSFPNFIRSLYFRRINIFPSSDYLEITAAVFVQSTNNKIPEKPLCHGSTKQTKLEQYQKGKQKSPGRATSRSRRQSLTPGGREKVTQTRKADTDRSVNYRATQNRKNIGTTVLERSVEYTTGGGEGQGLKAFHCITFTLIPI